MKKHKKNNRKSKNTKKGAFQLSVKILCVLVLCVQKEPFSTTWPKKRAPPKHYKLGVQKTKYTGWQLSICFGVLFLPI